MICCIISSFYIKPQHTAHRGQWRVVVLYLHSTSNHNCRKDNELVSKLYYIFILHQTTTFRHFQTLRPPLYYIFILHQTTTVCNENLQAESCIISSFYIKPQPRTAQLRNQCCCIISSFYIKPQPKLSIYFYLAVVLYLHSTSNHNFFSLLSRTLLSCIISSFYIKPQLEPYI